MTRVVVLSSLPEGVCPTWAQLGAGSAAGLRCHTLGVTLGARPCGTWLTQRSWLRRTAVPWGTGGTRELPSLHSPQLQPVPDPPRDQFAHLALLGTAHKARMEKRDQE